MCRKVLLPVQRVYLDMRHAGDKVASMAPSDSRCTQPVIEAHKLADGFQPKYRVSWWHSGPCTTGQNGQTRCQKVVISGHFWLEKGRQKPLFPVLTIIVVTFVIS